jgi:putative phosphoesterase
MRIAVMSDTHDNIWNLSIALEQINASGAEVLLHCGDLCAPFMIDRLGKGFAGPIHVIFGNNEGDGRLLQSVASKHSHVRLHGIYAELDIGGRRIAMIHYPEPALRIAQSGQFDLVCYGHNHQKKIEKVGHCVLANPGEVLGMNGSPTWGLYDCESQEFALQPIGE